ncbi:hypothetical protein S7711_01267 [Stachybotrys chartarum IBT 7711]|uniref:MalT-like TPR region domain-containing protein n=1 Tax=Stachybotrys chartarum (strain CBS 109288 / IBT 7711) TaxID=1280523 RepID=A0A084BBI2_STACB|nr:hypothetical protein S7711_01267 [Stachybotrys chartarum IBT 7711]
MALLDLGHVDEARLYLMEVYIESNEPKKAETMPDAGIQAGIRSLGKNHVGVLMGRGDLARVYARPGRFEKAEKLSLDIVKAIKATCGADHPDYIYGLWKLAQIYILQGKYEIAKDASKMGLERTGERLTPDHPLTKDLDNMVRVLEDDESTAADFSKLVPVSIPQVSSNA